MKITEKFKILLPTLFFLLLIGCGSDSDNGDTIKRRSETLQVSMQGNIMSGFFLEGTEVAVQALFPNTLDPDGRIITTSTTDALGRFSVSGEFDIYQAEIIAEGYYYNPVTGENSLSPVTFRAIVELTDAMDVNVNLLTTIATERIRYLVKNEGMDFAEAKVQAETEALQFFSVPSDIVKTAFPFEDIDILAEDENAKILLAAFISTQRNLSTPEFSEMISNIGESLSLEENVFSRYKTIRDFRSAFMFPDLSTIRTNIENRFSALGITRTVPAFESYIDTNGNGTFDGDDSYTIVNIGECPDDFGSVKSASPFPVFQEKIWLTDIDDSANLRLIYSEDAINWESVPNWPERYNSSAISFKDKLWLLGGTPPSSSYYAQTNDVWSSEDGLTWTQVTANAPWRSRCTHKTVVFNDRIWLFGGAYKTPCDEAYDNDGCVAIVNLSDIWYTKDGLVWEKSETDLPFNCPSNWIFTVAGNRIIAFGNYNIYWMSEDGENWKEIAWEHDFFSSELRSATFSNKTFIGGFVRRPLTNDTGDQVEYPISDFILLETTDGISWTQIPLPYLEVVNMAAKDNRLFLYENPRYSDWIRISTGEWAGENSPTTVWVMEENEPESNTGN